LETPWWRSSNDIYIRWIVDAMPREKKEKFRFEVFDDSGNVVYRAYVDSPTSGLRGAKLESFSAAGAQLQGIDMGDASLYSAYLFEADLSFLQT
jgi:hypothetical protein